MHEYKFIRVPASLAGHDAAIPPYETAVMSWAQDGWRLRQIFVENPAAVPSQYVLILERARGSS